MAAALRMQHPAQERASYNGNTQASQACAVSSILIARSNPPLLHVLLETGLIILQLLQRYRSYTKCNDIVSPFKAPQSTPDFKMGFSFAFALGQSIRIHKLSKSANRCAQRNPGPQLDGYLPFAISLELRNANVRILRCLISHSRPSAARQLFS